jgi:hypothetical protein
MGLASGAQARVAVVLGSGLGQLADRMQDRVVIPYATIPHFTVPTVAGHPGNLVAGTLGGGRVLALQGRFHDYEGHESDAVTFPVRVVRRLGVETLILTAAAGGIGVGYHDWPAATPIPRNAPRWAGGRWSDARPHVPMCWWPRTIEGPATLHYMIVPIWMPMMLAAAPTLWLWLSGRRSPRGLCPRCGYDRAGLGAGVACPECGQGG